MPESRKKGKQITDVCSERPNYNNAQRKAAKNKFTDLHLSTTSVHSLHFNKSQCARTKTKTKGNNKSKKPNRADSVLSVVSSAKS